MWNSECFYFYDANGNLITYEIKNVWAGYEGNKDYYKDYRYSYAYDEMGRMVSCTSSDGSFIAMYEYNDMGLLSRETVFYESDCWYMKEMIYDEAGNVQQLLNIDSYGYSSSYKFIY